MNLTIMLLGARGFVSREQIRANIAGYPEDDENFQRAFERDKEELRELGIPLRAGDDSVWHDQPGYRIERGEYELPELDFTPAEAAAVALAAQVWTSQAQSAQAVRALGKLRAAGVSLDSERVPVALPSLAVPEESFETLARALGKRQRVRFGYRGHPREVEPWLLLSRGGSWYLHGRDVARDEPRLFRLSRITSAVAVISPAGAYEKPEVAVAELRASLEPEADAEAVIAVRAGRAPALTRVGQPVEVAAPFAGYGCYRVRYSTQRDFPAQLAAFGPDVVVVEPQELRQQVVKHLEEVARWPS
jgi:proteasome accessory factor B